jgi:hypothetical protein
LLKIAANSTSATGHAIQRGMFNPRSTCTVSRAVAAPRKNPISAPAKGGQSPAASGIASRIAAVA